MNIIEIIKELEEDKRQRKITPSNALFIPLEKRALELRMSHDQITEQLSDLCNQNKIRFERTINDKSIIRV